MQRTVCGFTKLLLLIGFGALTLGWYRDVGAVAESQGSVDAADQLSGSRDPLHGTVPEGMRLVTLRVPYWSTVSGFVASGDRVDVVSVHRDKATVVLDNVLVRAVHTDGSCNPYPVTLLISDAQALTLAKHLPPVWLAPHDAARPQSPAAGVSHSPGTRIATGSTWFPLQQTSRGSPSTRRAFGKSTHSERAATNERR